MRPLFVVAALLCATGAGPAQDPDRTHGFAAASITPSDGPLAGRTFQYRILVPDDLAPDETVPLLLFLHGAGERGDDNVEQLRHLPDKWSRAEFRERHRAIVVAPQCPRGQMWMPVDWSRSEPAPPGTPAPYLELALAILDRVLAEQPVDPDRVLLTGLSMGGFGAFALAARHPERFAAVLPVCGGGDPATAAQFVDLPVWAWHGDRDHVVKPTWSRQMVDAIRTAGGICHYTELPGIAHAAWVPAYGPDGGLDWLFARRRGERYAGMVVGCDQAGARLVALDTGVDWAEAGAVRWSCALGELAGLPDGAAAWFDKPTDAKPLGRGDAVLVTASGGGVGIVRTADRALRFVARVDGNPHSAALLPDGSVVVASSIPGALSRLIPSQRTAPDAPPEWRIDLKGAHGVHFDASTGELFALGDDELAVFRFVDDQLVADRSQTIPSGPGPEPRGGHDLWPDPSGDLLVTDLHHAWRVTPRTLAFTPFEPQPRIDHAKSLVALRPAGPWLAMAATESWWSDGGLWIPADGTEPSRRIRPGARFYKLRPWP